MNSQVRLALETQEEMSPTEQEVVPPSSRFLDVRTAVFLLAAMIFLYSLLFVLPFIPIDHNIDGLTYVADGKRMFEGQVMYRDFFQFSTPGTALIYFFLFKLLGIRLWIPDVALLVLGVGLAWIGLVIAQNVMRPSLALLAITIFLVGIYRNLLDPTHHWYSLLTATAAIAALMERRTPARITAAGFLCGLTVCFTQSYGLAVTAGIGAFLWWESRRRGEDAREILKKEAVLVGPFFTVLVAVNAYFVWRAGLARFLWCTVVFGFKYWPKEAYVNSFLPAFLQGLPEFGSLHSFLVTSLRWLFLYAVVPFTCLLFFARYWRESGKKPTEYWARPMLLALVGSFMLLSVAPAPTTFRMAASALPGIILLGWFIDCPRKLTQAVAGALAVGVLLVVPRAVMNAQSTGMQILSTPQGMIAVTTPAAYEEYIWIQQHTRPFEYFCATFTDVYFYLDLRNPTPLPYITNTGYTTVQQVAEVIRSLDQHAPHYIAWSPGDVDVIHHWVAPSDDHLGPLRNYLHAHYRLVNTFKGSDEIWERKD